MSNIRRGGKSPRVSRKNKSKGLKKNIKDFSKKSKALKHLFVLNGR
jgi:hypothetical protein